MRKNNGITLIALVITIIVMLILVGVTVTVALQGGLFKTARKAATNTQEERDKELALSDEKVEIDGEKYDSIDEYVKGGVVPTVDDYGKYVKYGVDLNGDNNLENDWKVFYVDDKGNTFIIAADYVRGDGEGCSEVHQAITNSHMIESSSTGYEDFCFYWSSSTAEYHCYDGHNQTVTNDHTTKRTQCSFPEIFMPSGDFCDSGNHYYCSDHVGDNGKGGNVNSRCASSLLCSGNWKPLVDENYGAKYAIGGPTLEMWVASWDARHGTGKEETGKTGLTLYANGNANNNDKTGYYVGKDKSCTSITCNLSNCEGYNDTLYFPHKTYDNLNLDNGDTADDLCKGYWLASPSVNKSSYVMGVYCLGGVSANGYGNDTCGLRPLVCLESGVKLAKQAEQ